MCQTCVGASLIPYLNDRLAEIARHPRFLYHALRVMRILTDQNHYHITLFVNYTATYSDV